MMLTPEQLAELRDAALGATPQDIDKAEVIDTAQDGSRVIDCPVCNGNGYAVLEGDYCNYDSAAIGVQFYGIGNEHGAAERYFRAARPDTMLQLLANIDAQQARIAELEGAIGSALGGPYYMDPPDGGSVTLEEQLQRMANDAARYRWLRDKRKSKSENLLATLAVRHENGWSWRSAVGEELDAAIDAAMQK